MSRLILLLATAMALLQVIVADPPRNHQPLPYAAAPPAGYHGPAATYGGPPPMPYGQQMPNQAHFPQQAQQPTTSLKATLMERIHHAKNRPMVTKTLNSMKPLVGGAARFAAPAINKATTWTKMQGHHGHQHNNMMQQPAAYGTNPYPEHNFKPQPYGGVPVAASQGRSGSGPTRY